MTSLSLALGLGLGPRGGFDPVSLFADGSQGFIFDPSDISTLFQDSGGTTPVTAPGQNAVLMRDKSGRGNHATLTNVVYQVDGTGRPYLEFNGSTSSGVTPTITPGSDKAQLFAGVRKLSDAARAVVVELGVAPSTGVLRLEAPNSAGVNNYIFAGGGSTPVTLGATATAPDTSVVAGLFDIAASSTIVRRNGSVANTSSSSLGTGGLSTNPFYLGRRGGTTLPFGGRFYWLMAHFGAITAAQITQVEALANSKTGAY